MQEETGLLKDISYWSSGLFRKVVTKSMRIESHPMLRYSIVPALSREQQEEREHRAYDSDHFRWLFYSSRQMKGRKATFVISPTASVYA